MPSSLSARDAKRRQRKRLAARAPRQLSHELLENRLLLDGGLTDAALSSVRRQELLDGLQDFAHWTDTLVGQDRAATQLPLVDRSIGQSLGLRDIVQKQLINRIAAAPIATTADLVNVLKGLSTTTADFTISVQPSTVSGGLHSSPQGDELQFNLTFDALRESQANLNLGERAKYAGFQLDASTTVELESHFHFDFTFGIDLRPGLTADESFFLRVDSLKIGSAVNETSINRDAQVGLLEVQLQNGAVDLNAELSVGLNNPDGDARGNITSAELNNAHIGALTQIVTTDNSLSVNLPIFASLGAQVFGGSPQLNLSSSDVFSGMAPAAASNAGYDELRYFDNLQPGSLITVLQRVGRSLNKFAPSLDVNVEGGGIPFVNSQLSDVVDFDAMVARVTRSLYDPVINALRPLNLPADGRISGNAIFNIEVNDTDTHAVQVIAAQQLFGEDIVSLLNRKLPAELLGKVVFSRINGYLSLKATDPAISSLRILISDRDNPASRELGLETGQFSKASYKFDSIQSFASQLAPLLGVPSAQINPAYDVAAHTLRFDFDLQGTPAVQTVPLDFSSGLGPLTILEPAAATFTVTPSIQSTIGIELGNLQTRLTATSAGPANGQLSSAARFDVLLDGATYSVLVSRDTSNSSLDDLIADMNLALSTAGIGDRVKAGRDGNLITLSARAGSSLLVDAVAGNTANTELHLAGVGAPAVWSQHVFLDSGSQVQISAQISSSTITGAAALGILPVEITNGTTNISVSSGAAVAANGHLIDLQRNADGAWNIQEPALGLAGHVVLPVDPSFGVSISNPAAFDLALARPNQFGAAIEATGDAPDNGQLSANASFSLTVGDRNPIPVTIVSDSTNQTLDDLVADIDTALRTAGLAALVNAGRRGNRVTLSTTPFLSLSLSAAAGDPTITQLHLSPISVSPAVTFVGNSPYNEKLAPLRTFGTTNFIGSVQGILELFQSGKLNAFTTPIPLLNKSVDDVLGISTRLKNVIQQLQSQTGVSLKIALQPVVKNLKSAIIALPTSVSTQILDRLDAIYDALQYADINAERDDIAQSVNLPSYVVAAIAPLTAIVANLSAQSIDTTALNVLLTSLKQATSSLLTLPATFATALNAGSVQSQYVNANTTGSEQSLVLRTSWSPNVVQGVTLGSTKLPHGLGPLKFGNGSTVNLGVLGDLQFDFGYNLQTGTPFLLDTSRFNAAVSFSAPDLAYPAIIGGANVTLGSTSDPVLLRLANGTAVPASLGVTLNPTPSNTDIGNIPFADVPASLNYTGVNGHLAVKLPVYFTGNFQGNVTLDWDFPKASAAAAATVTAPSSLTPVLQSAEYNFEPYKDGIREFLKLLESVVKQDALGKLPLVSGDVNLQDAFTAKLKNQVYNAIQSRLDAVGGSNTVLLQTELFNAVKDALGPMLVANTLRVTATNLKTEITFQIRGTDTYQAGFDLDLKGLGVNLLEPGQVDLTVDYDLRLGFGIGKVEGFYFLIDSTTPQFTFNVDAELHKNSVLSGQFVNLPVVLKTNVDSAGRSLTRMQDAPLSVTLPDPDRRLTIDELDAGAFQIRFGAAGAHPHLDLHLTADVGLSAIADADLPSIVTDLRVDQHFNGGVTLDDAGSIPQVSLDNIGLSLGSALTKLVKPVLDKLNSFIAPIKPVLNSLDQEVPVISALYRKAGKDKFTWLDAISKFSGDPDAGEIVEAAKKAMSIVRTLNNLLNRVQVLSTTGAVAVFGNYQFNPTIDLRTTDPKQLNPLTNGMLSGGFLPTNDGTISPGIRDLDDVVGDFLGEELHEDGVRFPIFEDPLSGVRLLFGRDVEFVVWDLPEFHVPDIESPRVFIGIVPVGPIPVELYIGVELGVAFNVGLGFDTHGLTSNGTFLDGFFFRDEGRDATPVMGLTAGVYVDAEAGLPIIGTAGIHGTLLGNIGGFWKNDNKDDKVYLDELLANLDQGPECVFDIEGELTAQLYFTLSALFLSTRIPITPEITLFSFGDGCDPLPPAEIAHVSSGVELDSSGNTIPAGALILHIGPYAPFRQPGVSKDNDERVKVYEFEPGIMTVIGYGTSKQYGSAAQPITAIYGDAGQGNNVLLLDESVKVPSTLSGGAGNDRIRGGSGPNRIKGLGGKDLLIGGTANDVIESGDGDAKLYGRSGNDSFSAQGGNNYIDGDDGDDFIQGGIGGDLILAGNNNDTIYGGGGTDKIFGERGDDIIDGQGSSGDYIEGGLGNNTIKGSDGPDIIFAAAPTETLKAGEAGRNLVYGAAGNDKITGGPDNFSHLYGDAGDDHILGGSVGDIIHAGSGTDLIYAYEGDDLIFADSGTNSIYAGVGSDTVFGSSGPSVRPVNWPATMPTSFDTRFANVGHDNIYGEGGIDFIYGGVGTGEIRGGTFNDFIYGGTGSQVLHGDGSDDYLRTGDGNQQIFGDEGNDLVVQMVGANQSLADGQITGRGDTTLNGIERAELHDTSAGGGHTMRVEGWTAPATLFGSPSGTDTVAAVADADYVLVDGNLRTSLGGSFRLVNITDAAIAGVRLDNTIDVSLWTGTGKLVGGTGIDQVISAFDGNYTLSDTSLARASGANFALTGIKRVVLAGGPSANVFDARTYSGSALIYGGAGNDILRGGKGNDYLDGGTGDDQFQGNEGDDVVVATASFTAAIEGGSGNDLIYGSEGADAIQANSGNDRVYAYSGNDFVSGGIGDDILDGGAGNDTVEGDEGKDLILGAAGNDLVYAYSAAGLTDDQAVNYVYGDFGTKGNETGTGDDTVAGGLGHDLLFGEGGTNVVTGGTAGTLSDNGAGTALAGTLEQPPIPLPTNWPPQLPGLTSTLPDGTDYRGRWTEYAGSATSGGVSNSLAAASEPSIAVGVPGQFVAWTDRRTGTSQTYVALHTSLGWQELADSAHAGGVSNRAGSARQPSIALDSSGLPIVAWTQATGTSSDILVARYDAVANAGLGSWVSLGTSLSSGGISSTGAATHPRVFQTATGPVVVWLDKSSGVDSVYARRFENGAWTSLGANADTGRGVSQSLSNVTDLAVTTDGTKIAVAWTQNIGGRTQIYLRQFDGTTWNALGNSTTGNGVSGTAANASSPSLAYSGGTLFAAWQDNSSGKNEIYAAQFTAISWAPAGDSSNSGGGVSSTRGSATRPELAANGNRLYVAWIDDRLANLSGNTSGVYVKRWDGTNFREELVGDASHRGIADMVVDPTRLALAVDAVGHPFAAWSDNSSGKSEIYFRGNTFDIGTVHYVNDRDAVSGDQFGNSVVTAPGSDANDGLSPSKPKRTLQAVLNDAAHPINPGDVIILDAGTIEGTANLTALANGVLLRGSPHEPSILEGLIFSSNTSNVALSHLKLLSGIVSNNDTNLSLVDSDIGGLGITISGGSYARVVNNRIDAGAFGVRLEGAAQTPFVQRNTIRSRIVDIAALGQGASGVQIRSNHLRGSGDGLRFAAPMTGYIGNNRIEARATGLRIWSPFIGMIEGNDISRAIVGVQYDAGVQLSANRIHHNVTGVQSTVTSTVQALGFLGNTKPNQIYENSTGVNLQQSMLQNQHVFANVTGISGTGEVVSTDLQHANVVELNSVGISVPGHIQFNHIHRNNVGIAASTRQVIDHNVLKNNLNAAVQVRGTTETRIINNTLYTETGDLVVIDQSSSGTELLNNIFWNSAGFDIYVANDSQTGYFSDYNNLHASGSAKLVHWSNYAFTDILDWQEDVFQFDLHSIGRTVVNPLWSQPRFVSPLLNDFRVFGLAAGQRISSPTIDAGDARIDLPASTFNLLANPNFELDTNGWNTSPTGTTQVGSPVAFAGTKYFTSGLTNAGFVEQTVDLLPAGFTQSQLDSRQLVAVFGGRVRSSNEQPSDQGQITLRFFEENGFLLAETTVAAGNEPDRWELVGGRVPVPNGTRRIGYRFETVRLSGTTSDSYLDGAFVSLLHNSVAADQGALGNSLYDSPPVTNSLNPATAASGHIALKFPDLYTDWQRDEDRLIRWQSYNNSPRLPVRIDLYRDTAEGPQLLANISPSTADDGEFEWSPQDNGVNFGTKGLRIQISLVGNTSVLDRSTESFAVPENTTTFFVNHRSDASSPGDNRNTGKLANSPKPYPNNILRIYSLAPANTLTMGKGIYGLFHPILISNIASLGDDEGFAWSGPATAGSVAQLQHANPAFTSAPIVELDDADSVSMAYITTEGGTEGIWIHGASDDFAGSHLTTRLATGDGLRIESLVPGSTLDHIHSIGNGGFGVSIYGPIDSITNSDIGFNQNSGLYAREAATASIEGNFIHDNRNRGIHIVGGNPTIGNTNLALGRGNIVADNAWHGIDTQSGVVIAGNKVSGHRAAGAAGIMSSGTAQHNIIFDNYIGIDGGGTSIGNRAYNNALIGINVWGSQTAAENVIYNNPTGMQVLGPGLFNPPSTIRNNLLYDNFDFALKVHSKASLINNTFYQSNGDAIHILPRAENIIIRNNILWTTNGHNIYVPSSSQLGFQSDYNLLYADDDARIGYWQGAGQFSLADWQNATFWDQNSLSQDPLFVNQAAGDFHVKSQFGSYHGGSLAPVISSITGLPVMPAATLTIDAAQSPAIDRGDATYSFTNEPVPNGNFINLGTYGNTLQASISPAEYVLVMRPDGGEVWPAGQTFPIRWRSHDSTGNVRIELFDGNNALSGVIVDPTPNDGEYLWSIPTTLAGTYQVKVTRLDAGMKTDTSNSTFSVPPPIHVYYVNDGTVAAGQWTTAPGSDANDGLSAATPKASIRSVLEAYDLGPGDKIRVDAGTYNLTANTLILANDSGVTIEGFHAGPFTSGANPFGDDHQLQTIINRDNTSSGSYAFQLNGADDVTLDNLAITGGEWGVVALNGADSDRIAVTGSEVYGNSRGGIFTDTSNDSWRITGNRVFANSDSGTGITLTSTSGAVVSDNSVYDMQFGVGINVTGAFGGVDMNWISGNNVYFTTYGILANSSTGYAPVTINDNDAHEQRFFGISNANHNVFIRGNKVHHNPSVGISGSDVRDNIVFDNGTGIDAQGAGITSGNRVFHNDIGISGWGGSRIHNNTVYANQAGIEAFSGSVSIQNNLLYDQSTVGLRVRTSNGVNVLNNTIYQPNAGDALRLESSSNIRLENNILSVGSGYAIHVAADSQNGFASNYNTLQTAGKLARWQNRDFTSRTDWFYELGFDQHSQTADPQFIDVNGIDEVLSYSTVPNEAPRIVDDGGSGFQRSGDWDHVQQSDGFGGDFLEARRSSAFGVAASYQFARSYSYTTSINEPVSAYWKSHRGLGDAQYSHSTTATWIVTAYDTFGNINQYPQSKSFSGVLNTINQRTSGSGAHNVGSIAMTFPDYSSDASVISVSGITVSSTIRLAATDSVIADAITAFATTVDDGDAAFSRDGHPWVNPGQVGDYHRRPANNATGTASWEFTGLTAGAYYDVAAIWTVFPDIARDVVFTLFDGNHAVRWAPRDLINAPNDFQDENGVSWNRLGVMQVTGDRLIVKLEGSGNLQADAIRVQRLRGDGGPDNDFHVATSSPTIDAGNPASQFSSEPQPNGGRVNSGSMGNTSHATTSAAQMVQVLAPNGLEKLEQGQQTLIKWRTSGVSPPADVDIHLQNELTGSRTLIAQGVSNTGQFAWTVPSDAEGLYRITVTANQGILPSDESDSPLQIVNNGRDYYVNDASLTGDVFTSAIGNNANSGKSSDQPMASLSALVAAYDLEPGDVIHVDTGNYQLLKNIVLDGTDSGVRIEGPGAAAAAPVTAVATLDRGNQSIGAYGFQLQGADDVTIDHLQVIGGEYGIVALDNVDSDRITIIGSDIYGHAQRGVFIGATNDNALIENNTIHDNVWGGIYGYNMSGLVARNNTIYKPGYNPATNVDQSTGIEIWFGTNHLIEGNEIYGQGRALATPGGGNHIVRSNRVHDNRRGMELALGVVATENEIYANTNWRSDYGFGLLLNAGSQAINNNIYGNGAGVLTSGATVSGNRISNNTQFGIFSVTGSNLITDNVIYASGTGIQAYTGDVVRNNLINANATAGLRVVNGIGNIRLENNTIHQPTSGNAVEINGLGSDVFGNHFGVTVINNILSVATGYAIQVGAQSERQFVSDYNDFHITGTGKLGRWEDRDFTALSDWYFELGLDQHSLVADPQFSSAATGDFSVLLGSPTIDAGDPATAFVNEPSSNGGRVNLGHTGNTIQATTSGVQFIQLLSPVAHEKFEFSQEMSIQWRTHGLSSSSLVDIELLTADHNSVVTTVASGTINDGLFVWQVPANLPEGNYAVRITSQEPSTATSSSRAPLVIANNGTHYYINDMSPNGYIFASAPGDNLASGKSPTQPMATLQALISAYDLDAGDVIHVDAGAYRLYRSVLLAQQDSGVRIEGPGAVAEGQLLEAVATLNRGNRSEGIFVVNLAGADDVTIDHLSITGGVIGVYANRVASDRLTISNSDVFANYGNEGYGVYIDRNNADARVVGNRIHNNVNGSFIGRGVFAQAPRASIENNETYGQTIGIETFSTGSPLPADASTIRGNTSHDNTFAGIISYENDRVLNNVVFGHVATGAFGISSMQNTVSGNVVYKNYDGIRAHLQRPSQILNNRVFNNSNVGIDAYVGSLVDSNQIYSNSVGARLSNFFGTFANNLLYANTNRGLTIDGSDGPVVVGNTIYQSVGDAVRFQSNSRNEKFFSNIVWVDSGYALHVDSSSQTGFTSNYNLLHQGADPNANVGFWGSLSRDSLNDWRMASSQDTASVATDPMFVDRDGADNVLGFRTTDAYDGGLDDNFHLRRGSVAIDHGGGTGSLAHDFEGNVRRDDVGTPNQGAPGANLQPGFIDIGAFEFQGSSSDTTAPVVVSSAIRILGSPADRTSKLIVVFSEPIDPIDARSKANYELREAGANGTFDDSDDVIYELAPHYVAGQTEVSLDIVVPGGFLPRGKYRLTINGNSSIHDLAANRLDGDNDGAAGGNSISINSQPLLTAINNQTVSEGLELSFTVTASDAQVVTYSLGSEAPAGATVDGTSGLFRWTPSEVQGPGTYSITVIATDAGSPSMTDSQSFTVTVGEANTPPSVAEITAQSVDEGSELSVQVSATDSDVPANSLTYSLGSGAPDGAQIHSTSGLFTWTPSESQGPALHNITVIVTDNGSPTLSSSRTFAVTVGEVNAAPVLGTIHDRIVEQQQTLSISASATDPDLPANGLSFSLEPGAPAGATIDSASGLFTWTPADVGTYTVGVRVTDDGSPAKSDVKSFTVTVRAAVSGAPVPEILGAPISSAEGVQIELSSSVTDDGPATSLTYSWTVTKNGSPFASGANSDFSFTPDDNGAYEVLLAVTDADSNTGSTTKSIAVTNVAPSAGVSAPARGVRSQPQLVQLAASDVSAVDQAAAFEFLVDWGDGSDSDADGFIGETISGLTGLNTSHRFAATGIFEIAVIARDKDGSQSVAATRMIDIVAAELQGNDLIVGGTSAADSIVFSPVAGAKVGVVVNGTSLGPFTVEGMIRVFDSGGVDRVTVAGSSAADSFIVNEAGVVFAGKTYTGESIEQFLASGVGGNDSFVLSASALGAIDGGAGTDTIFAADATNTWNITGSNTGNMNEKVFFTTAESIVGGALNDTFKFSAAQKLSGVIHGGGGNNTFDYSLWTTAISFNLQTNAATGAKGGGTGGFSQIQNVIGGAALDRITAPNTSSTWTITAQGTGNLNGSLQFASVEKYTGGTAADTLVVATAGPLTGTFDGGLGSDILQAYNQPNVWTINNADAGKLNTFTYAKVENLIGGDSPDSFKFSDARTLTGNIAAGGGIDTLDFSLYTTPLDIDLTAGSATPVNIGAAGAISGIEYVYGGLAGDTLVGNGLANLLIGNGGDDILRGNDGADVLLGGLGNDRLEGGAGRDWIVGGSGADSILAGAGEDIVIAALLSTSFYAESSRKVVLSAIDAVMSEWTRDIAFTDRVNHLNGTASGGTNGTYYLRNTTTKTVTNESTSASDSLTGDDDRDWFFARLSGDGADAITDLEASNEKVTTL